jgi:hypothetical protein
MKLIGKARSALCILFLAVAASGSLAAVNASLDRQRAALGDTLRLTITATDDEDLDQLDLRPLTADFEILQRSNSSKTSYVNGQFSSTREILLDISPRREGNLAVPPLQAGPHVTSALPVIVSPSPKGSGGDQNLIFEAELDRSSAYVQGQVILTLRLQQAINLDDRSITELQLDNAFVRPLEQNSFQRTVDGRPWLVHEVRYAIFPEQSGTLEIPAQTFSARESSPRRSLFDARGSGRQLRQTTQPLTIQVLPRPGSFPGSEWLPARKLSLEESWSTPPEDLKVGESATRTITLRGEGLQGAQLPPVMYPPAQGLKYYPDQPAISDLETATGLIGTRVDSVAVVPTQAGRWQIPEIRIPWWDTQSNELRYAVLPERELEVAAGDPLSSAPLPNPMPSNATLLTPDSAAPIPLVASDDSRLWQIIAAINGAGWLLSLFYLAWTRRRKQTPEKRLSDDPREHAAFKSLLLACSNGQALQARSAIVSWTAALTSRPGLASMAQVSSNFEDPALNTAIEVLNAALYSSEQSQWDGNALAEAARKLRSEHRKGPPPEGPPLQLYPQGA